MLNYLNLVGRLVEKPTLKKSDDGRETAELTLAVPRSFKNVDGIYDTDFIKCNCWDSVAVNTHEYCNPGDVVCVKGRLSSMSNEDGKNKDYKLNVIAEKVTFLSTRNISNPKKDMER